MAPPEMRRAPRFWQDGGLLAGVLAPVSAIVAGVTALRMRRQGWVAPIPVLCVGNATVGGAGKTTVALDLTRRLKARGYAPHVLLRGYGGSARGLTWVNPDDPAAVVGDEALLHAAVAPTWVCTDRALAAQAAVSALADVLVMDDGLQNSGLRKDASLLVIDGAAGFGNGRVLPAGPLREPVAAAARRCKAAVLIGADATGALVRLPSGFLVLRARLVPDGADLVGKRVVGFAGIAMPDKFFGSLAETGAEVVGRVPFPDHHLFTETELAAVLARAEESGAVPVTTAKDAVRLPAPVRDKVRVLGVRLEWEDPAAVEELLAGLPYDTSASLVPSAYSARMS